MLQGILIIVVFLVIAALMITRKIPTLLALPLLAVAICLIAGVPFVGKDANGANIGFLQTVIEGGATRMAAAYAAVIFGAWLGQLMNQTGVTSTIIRKSAELGGDRPLIVTIVLVIAVALLFTTLAGLGSVIMVGSIVLPILVSIGVPAISAACIFLMAFATGLCFNMSNWQTFSSIFSLEIEYIRNFEYFLVAATFLATLVLVFIEFKKNGVKFAFSAPAAPQEEPEEKKLKGVTGALAMVTPLIPILLVIIFKVPIIPAFFAGIIWILIFTFKGWSKAMNMLTKTCYDGISNAAPAVILMIGIGMLYMAVTNPMVKEVLNPFMLAITPKTRITYMIFFIILAPLALYRGPLNLFGLGSGIAALIIGLNTIPALAVMGAFLSAERIQGVGDPTNTQNVWTANFVEVDVNAITKKLLPYLWVIAAIGVVISGILYF
ncbi:C4-dicarboxylate ABC transporter [Breznakiella homolactica]|uniref:C4-dicarboxylate ABC transporter n=1 Tax=Breznakiella homolactica TaxID=2798577 RepID=A0A7T7XRI2_9SPIR|nr:C4-dicarboxylate ABC transporter [Breznakiella homolactica]QQO11174.1 C4-dicarboxylate ABC transporter [Breznakiella homolactica]